MAWFGVVGSGLGGGVWFGWCGLDVAGTLVCNCLDTLVCNCSDAAKARWGMWWLASRGGWLWEVLGLGWEVSWWLASGGGVWLWEVLGLGWEVSWWLASGRVVL